MSSIANLSFHSDLFKSSALPKISGTDFKFPFAQLTDLASSSIMRRHIPTSSYPPRLRIGSPSRLIQLYYVVPSLKFPVGSGVWATCRWVCLTSSRPPCSFYWALLRLSKCTTLDREISFGIKQTDLLGAHGWKQRNGDYLRLNRVSYVYFYRVTGVQVRLSGA